MLPNLLIIGAAKSGTSSLYRYLGLHPDIFMSSFKEPAFFAWEGKQFDFRGPGAERVREMRVNDIRIYESLFEGASGETVVGEASTAYLPTPRAPYRMREYAPEAKLIAIRRNPVDRAYSAYLHARLDGYEPLADFQQALEEEPTRIRERWNGLTHYKSVGLYGEQLDRYLQVFPPHHIRVYLFEDLERSPQRVVGDASTFLSRSRNAADRDRQRPDSCRNVTRTPIAVLQ